MLFYKTLHSSVGHWCAESTAWEALGTRLPPRGSTWSFSSVGRAPGMNTGRSEVRSLKIPPTRQDEASSPPRISRKMRGTLAPGRSRSLPGNSSVVQWQGALSKRFGGPWREEQNGRKNVLEINPSIIQGRSDPSSPTATISAFLRCKFGGGG